MVRSGTIGFYRYDFLLVINYCIRGRAFPRYSLRHVQRRYIWQKYNSKNICRHPLMWFCCPKHTSAILGARNYVCPSVCHTHALWQNEKTYCRYVDTIMKEQRASFLTPTAVGVRRPLPPEIALKVTHTFQKRRLRPISAYNVSTVNASEKVQLTWIGSRPRAFQRAIDKTRRFRHIKLSLSPPKVGSKICCFCE